MKIPILHSSKAKTTVQQKLNQQRNKNHHIIIKIQYPLLQPEKRVPQSDLQSDIVRPHAAGMIGGANTNVKQRR
jgi:hypothetical protein